MYTLVVLILLLISIIFWNLFINGFIKYKHTLFGVPLDIEVCHNNLADLHNVFNKHGVPFWLSEGTALGFIRGGEFISHDDDVDIGMWERDHEKLRKLVIPDLSRLGFTCTRVGLSTFYTLQRGGEKVDIDIVGPELYCVANLDSCRKLLPYLREFNEITIKNRRYKVPGTDYLEYLYGPDWTTPKKSKVVQR